MNSLRKADRRTLLTGLGGAALVSSMGGTVRAQEAEAKPEMYGITFEETEPKKEEMGLMKKPKLPMKVDGIEVLKYNLVGGPIVFHGEVFVDTTNNDNTLTFGEVSKGPPPFTGLYEGYYLLTKAKPNVYFYDVGAKPREALNIKLGLLMKSGVVVYRTGHKRLLLPGWVWSSWSHPLQAW